VESKWTRNLESTIIIRAIFTIFVLKVVKGFSSGNPENTLNSPGVHLLIQWYFIELPKAFKHSHADRK
jgi:hypothetical protein